MEKLIVKNFKAIEYAEIEVNDLTFFIGQQASGKSTLAKLVYFFKTLGRYLSNELLYVERNKDNSDVSNKILSLIAKSFFAFFGNTNSFKIEYNYSGNRIIEIYSDSEESILVDYDSQKKLSLSNDLIVFLNDYNQLLDKNVSLNSGSFELLESRIKKSINYMFPYLEDTVYFPAGRSFFSLANKYTAELGRQFKDDFNNYLQNGRFKTALNSSVAENALINSSFINHCFFLKDIFQSLRNVNFEYKEAVQFNIKEEKILNGIYQQINNEEWIKTNTNELIHLSNSSSGQQETLRLIQDIFYSLNYVTESFRVYEEPEAHLFPASQKALMEMIVILLNTNPNVQLLISTHTPYLLAVLNILMKAKELEKQLGENSDVLDALVAKEERLDVKRVCVYSAKQTENGKFIFENVVNQGAQSIDAEILDEVTEQIEIIYEQLLDLQVSISNSITK